MDAMILGAGMVGVATALALQERGKQVALIDKSAPGCETSYGNAGMIQCEAAEPYAFPRAFGAISAAITARTNDVHWHWRAIPSHMRPLWSYFMHSSPARHARISTLYARLTRRATADHETWIAASGAGHLVRRGGYRAAYRTERKLDEAVAYARRMSETHGVRSSFLTASELAASEPGLLSPMIGAIHWIEPWSCVDPGELVRTYARHFVRLGGTIVEADAMSLSQAGNRWQVQTSDGKLDADNAVVALGPWSPSLLAKFGYALPMFRKRGYHRHFAVRNGPSTPFYDVENGAFCSPMNRGLRICTGAEFASLGAPATPVQLTKAEMAVRTLFELGEPVDAVPWVGNRPCMPDMLPVVGRATRHKNLWIHTGHGHQGFTLGPTTSRLLAAQMAGDQADPELMQALRFGR